MKIETVKVEHEGERGFKIINKSDFKKGVHKEYKDKKTPKELLLEEAILLKVEGAGGMTVEKLKEAIDKVKAN